MQYLMEKYKNIMVGRNLENNYLIYIKSNFGILPDFIIHLEPPDRSQADSVQIVTDFQHKIQEVRNYKKRLFS